MLEPSRPNGRTLANRRVREVDVYGGPADAEPARPNVFAVIWRRRWLVISCVVIGLVAAALFFAEATPIFSSTSTVYVQDNALKIVNDPMGGTNRSQNYLYTQCQLITSTAILSDALQKPGVAQAKTLQGIENPVGVLKASITAAPDKFSDLINVTMECPDPQDAATLVNAVVEAYIDYQGKSHKSTAVEVLKIFQKEVDQHEQKLAETQTAILKLKRENPDLTFQTDKGSIVTSKLGDLANQLTLAQLRALNVRTAAAEAEAVKDDPAALRRLINQSQLTADQEVADPALAGTYRASRDRLNDLLGRLGDKNQLVKEARDQVGRLQQELQQTTRDTAANYAQLLVQSQRVADRQVTELQKVMADARKSAVDLNFKQADFEQLIENKERITRSLDLLDSRMKEINVNEDVGSLTVSVLETAKAGFAPVRPVRGKTLGMGLVGGLMAGVGLAMLRDLLDHRLRSADEITNRLELPILGAVPRIMSKTKDINRARLVQAQPRSTTSEAYRTIRTALSFGSADGGPGKTILFTSPAPGDGKSTCVSNLSIAFAQSGRRTLLIDADCRRPTQDRAFDLSAGRGLADVLAGDCTLDEAVRKTDMDKLDILPCGTIPHNPAELLDSQALLDLLGRVSADYDQVLIDSPPVTAVTDARILGASADVAVLVLRADKTTRRVAEHARDSLQSVGANLIGVIINDVPRGASGYGYDYYSTGHYGYKPSAARVAAANGSDNGAMVVADARTIDG